MHPQTRRLLVGGVLALSIVVAGCLGGGTAAVPFNPPADSAIPEYEVVAKEDQSFSADNGKVVQLVYSVRTTPGAAELNETQMLAVGQAVIADVAADREISEITVFLFAEDVPVGAGACGVVTWAPDGEFGNAQDIDPGEYSTHEFSVQKNVYFCQPF